MKNIMRLEIHKALKNKLFVIPVLLGCALTVLSLVYCVNVYHHDIVSSGIAHMSTQNGFNPNIPAYTLFNDWAGGEGFSLGTSVYFFIFPLLISIPYGWSYSEEKKKGYVGSVAARSGKLPYFLSKYAAVFISGGLAMILPLVFNFFLSMLFFPAIVPEVTYCTVYGIFASSLMSGLFYTHPFLYVFFYLCLDFVYCGLLACISLAASAWVRQKWVVVILPLFFCLAITYGQRFIYTSPTTVQYKQISPLYFLHPIELQHPASWSVILISAAVIFIVTLSIHLLWEGRHEIY